MRLEDTKRDNDVSNEVTKGWRDIRHILTRRWEDLTPQEKFKLRGAFDSVPRLKPAYFARNEFAKIFDLSSRGEAAEKLREWECALPSVVAEEFQAVTKPLSNWREEILNYFDHGFTNGYIEGVNRAIRQIRSEGAGYSFEVLRAKVIHGLDRHRRDSNGTSVMYQGIPSDMPPAGTPAFFEEVGPSKEFQTGVSLDRIAEELELE